MDNSVRLSKINKREKEKKSYFFMNKCIANLEKLLKSYAYVKSQPVPFIL